MKSMWQTMTARFDALQRRERRLIAVAILGGIVMIGSMLFIEPSLKRTQLAEKNIAGYRAQLSNLQAQMTVLQAPERNPDVAARAELERLRKQLEELSVRFKTLESTLVPPEQMAGLLEDMVGKRSGLRLLSLKTLPVAPLVAKDVKATKESKDTRESEKEKTADAGAAGGASADREKSGSLFKHGVEIRLEGSYQELAAYLERLEKSRMKLLWSSVSLSAEKYPRLVLTLTVYSLSLDQAWLVV